MIIQNDLKVDIQCSRAANEAYKSLGMIIRNKSLENLPEMCCMVKLLPENI